MRNLISVKRAHSIIDKFRTARVLIIGDLVMDHFIWGRVRRISPEAPVPVVEVTSESLLLGGSANVANNIVSLNGCAMVTGVAGSDYDGKKLMASLKEKRISTEGVVVDKKRPTTIKTRVIAHSQQVVRFDRESRDKIDPLCTSKMLNYIRKAAKDSSVVVISDYAKGVITEGLVDETRRVCKRLNKPLLVDPKVEHFDLYRGATLVTPNNLEASVASGIDIEDEGSLRRAGAALLGRLGSSALLITRGEHGMALFEQEGETHIPTVAREVFDVSGAGDTVIAALSLAIASGADFREASVIANFAAGVVVGKVGTATLSRQELKEAISSGLKHA